MENPAKTGIKKNIYNPFIVINWWAIKINKVPNNSKKI